MFKHLRVSNKCFRSINTAVGLCQTLSTLLILVSRLVQASITKLRGTLIIKLTTVILAACLLYPDTGATAPKNTKKNAKKKLQATQSVAFNHRYKVPQVILTPFVGLRRFTSGMNSLTPFPTVFSWDSTGYYIVDEEGNKILLTLKHNLQELVERELERVNAHTVAIVITEVKTGKILAYAGKSVTVPNPVLHNRYRVASLFKVITAAAAIDFAKLDLNKTLYFRGGLYELSQANFNPDPGKDRFSMSIEEGLAKSVNPVFARLALRFLDDKLLSFYSDRFGFNWRLPSDFDLPVSQGYIPSDDYELARTAAGFGTIFLTPVHACALMASIGNRGYMLAPKIVDMVISKRGGVVYSFQPTLASKTVTEESARVLLESMISTHTIGTARRAFENSPNRTRVAGKTGTLTIEDPRGLLLSYAAVFPVSDPKYALAVFTVQPQDGLSRATQIARRIIDQIL